MESDKIIGSIIGADNGRRAWIYHCAIDPDYQKKRIGTILFNKLVFLFKEKSVTKIILGVALTNLKTIPFYEKLGCSITNDAVLMEKKLS